MGSGYYGPMDREYVGHHQHGHGFPGSQSKSTTDVSMSIGDFGISMGLGPIPNVQAMQAYIRPGAKKLEFVFSGTGKGQPGQQTPGMYGKRQREAFVEIGKVNKVDFTTHATFGVYGLAGMDQQGNFSKASKNFSLQEVKRAIEFAADVAFGGPVVVHTGEFQRPLIDSRWNQEDQKWKDKFRMFDDEEGRTSFRVVDTRTGGVIEEARKNKRVPRPVWLTAKPGEEYEENGVKKKATGRSDEKGRALDENGIPIYLDYFGKKVDPSDRVPRFSSEKQEFEIEQLGWEDLVQEAQVITERARIDYRKWKNGQMTEKEFKDSPWYERLKDVTNENEIKVRPEEAYIIATLETNAAHSRGWALQYGGDFKEIVDNIKKLRKAEQFYEKIEASVDPEEKWKLKQQVRPLLGSLIPEDAKYPTELIKEQLRDFERRLRYSKEASASQWSQAKQSEETQRYVQSAETYAFKESCDSYARAAMSAMRHTEALRKKGTLKKPIAIAMENLFPEQYGAHPDELIDLVKGSRDRMAKMLKEEHGLNMEEAKKRAKDHITSTFDTGHMNMWRKYWVGDSKKSLEQNDRDFDKWAVEKFSQMIDAGIIGHVHLDDNYGYHDDHLAPGEGNAPIREMVKLLKEKGYKGELIVEPGADYTTDVSGFHSVMKTWQHFNAPAYGSGSGISSSARWGQVQYGWFGQTQPPYFTFGGYGPSEDWQLWSQVPLE